MCLQLQKCAHKSFLLVLCRHWFIRSQLQEYKLDCMVNSYQNMLSHVQVPAGPSWTCSHRVLLLQGLDKFNGSLGLFEESLMGLSRILFPKQQMVTRQIIFDF